LRGYPVYLEMIEGLIQYSPDRRLLLYLIEAIPHIVIVIYAHLEVSSSKSNSESDGSVRYYYKSSTLQ
jgi:hypothetical protein